MNISLKDLCAIVRNINDFDNNANQHLRGAIGSALHNAFYDSSDEKPEEYALLNDASNFNYADEQLIFLCEDFVDSQGSDVELEINL